MFKLISKYLKEFSILILVLGIIRQLVYYSYFGIPIKYFFSLSELWLIIADKLIYISPIILVIIFGADILVTRTSVSKIEETDATKNSTAIAHDSKNRILDRKIEKREKIIFRLFLLLFAIAALVYLIITTDYVVTISMSATIFMLVIFFIVFDLFQYSTDVKVFFGFVLSVGVFFIVFLSALEIRTVQHGKYRGTKIITTDTTYTSNDSSYFIGKTESYIFLYNKYDTSTIIIPKESIKQIIFKTRKTIYSKAKE